LGEPRLFIVHDAIELGQPLLRAPGSPVIAALPVIELSPPCTTAVVIPDHVENPLPIREDI